MLILRCTRAMLTAPHRTCCTYFWSINQLTARTHRPRMRQHICKYWVQHFERRRLQLLPNPEHGNGGRHCKRVASVGPLLLLCGCGLCHVDGTATEAVGLWACTCQGQQDKTRTVRWERELDRLLHRGVEQHRLGQLVARQQSRSAPGPPCLVQHSHDLGNCCCCQQQQQQRQQWRPSERAAAASSSDGAGAPERLCIQKRILQVRTCADTSVCTVSLLTAAFPRTVCLARVPRLRAGILSAGIYQPGPVRMRFFTPNVDAGTCPISMTLHCRYAINTGTDGDLTTGWQLLPGHQFHESGPTVPDQLDLGAPSVHYDGEEGYYYTIGGGSVTAGPVRSKTLEAGSWEMSPLAPMAPPASETAKVGLPAVDNHVFKGFYVDVWERETPEDERDNAAFLANMSRWNYGVTDPDFCCSDGKSPSYMLHTASQQGKPHDAPPGKTTEFAALVRYNGTLNEWLRSYFP